MKNGPTIEMRLWNLLCQQRSLNLYPRFFLLQTLREILRTYLEIEHLINPMAVSFYVRVVFVQLRIVNFSAVVWNCSLYWKEVGGRAKDGFSWNWQRHSLCCGSLFCGLLSWCRKTDLPREERKQMLSPGLGKKIECVGVWLIKGGS